jgi:hypothetical protein
MAVKYCRCSIERLLLVIYFHQQNQANMKVKILIIVLLAAFSTQGQTVGPIELKEYGDYGMKKIAESPKKVFIETFKVNYQLFETVQERSSGGSSFGGGVRGDVKVKLTVGLDGLVDKALIETTDNIYNDFVERLKKEGYEIIPFESVIGLKEYEGWERMKGGIPSRSQFKGYISVAPSGYEYFVKRVTDAGKEKGTFMDNGFKISKELDEALVVKVSITIPMCHDAESTGSKLLGDISKGIVNVVLETGMQMSNEYLNTTATSVVNMGVTGVSVFRGGKKFQDNSTSNWILKKTIDIEGAIDKKKFREGAVAKSDVFGTDMGMFQLFSADNVALDKMHSVKVNMPLYQKGVEMGSKKFLNMVVDEIMKYAK